MISMMPKSITVKNTRAALVICAQTFLLASAGPQAQAASPSAIDEAASNSTARLGAGATTCAITSATTGATISRKRFISIAIADSTPAAAANSDDDRAIRQQAGDYAKAYAARDAKTLAAMWTEDGSFVDSLGQSHHGRSAIEEFFQEGFKQRNSQTLDIVIDSIKFPAPGVAIEEGTTRIASGQGLGSMGRYLVVHSKVDGKWLMSSCEETDCSARSISEYLKELDWLVGSWSVKEQPQAAHLKVNWSKNKTFLICRYISPKGTDSDVEEVQIIGWDPQNSQIVVWHFGSAGGFGCGKMTFDGKEWIERASATEPDGTSGRARYKITRVDDNSFTWQSSNRTLEGKALPDASPLTIVRDRIQ
jgi:uncharacterized protein (TIGR02246 family)